MTNDKKVLNFCEAQEKRYKQREDNFIDAIRDALDGLTDEERYQGLTQDQIKLVNEIKRSKLFDA